MAPLLLIPRFITFLLSASLALAHPAFKPPHRAEHPSSPPRSSSPSQSSSPVQSSPRARSDVSARSGGSGHSAALPRPSSLRSTSGGQRRTNSRVSFSDPLETANHKYSRAPTPEQTPPGSPGSHPPLSRSDSLESSSSGSRSSSPTEGGHGDVRDTLRRAADKLSEPGKLSGPPSLRRTPSKRRGLFGDMAASMSNAHLAEDQTTSTASAGHLTEDMGKLRIGDHPTSSGQAGSRSPQAGQWYSTQRYVAPDSPRSPFEREASRPWEPMGAEPSSAVTSHIGSPSHGGSSGSAAASPFASSRSRERSPSPPIESPFASGPGWSSAGGVGERESGGHGLARMNSLHPELASEALRRDAARPRRRGYGKLETLPPPE